MRFTRTLSALLLSALIGACGVVEQPLVETSDALKITERCKDDRCLTIDVGPECGGRIGLSCPEGYWCVDRPNDGCDLDQGDADCTGVCLRPIR